MPSVDILGSALRKAKRISPTKGNMLTAIMFFSSILTYVYILNPFIDINL